MTSLDPRIAAVTDRIIERSKPTRRRYLDVKAEQANRGMTRPRLSCGNFAHGFAAAGEDKDDIRAMRGPNLAIVTSFNDMLSAHQPYERYPPQIKIFARQVSATAQVAGGVPAMCDGVTQGQAGMDLSLFSRDVIALSTAVALSNGMFDGVAMLGMCDKIVPGLLIGVLHFGHLPTVFVPAGPMTSGLSNNDKAKVRELAVQGKVGRDELLQAESQSYHGLGTCTFYGTANSNQMLLEAMGLHVPGTAFVNPGAILRDELTREAVRTVLGQGTTMSGLPGVGTGAGSGTGACTPIGKVVNERCIVNAMVALLATGGSTNHLIHWVAVARAAGIVIDWDDFSALSDVVPLLARVYPNGSADVNQFQAAGGPGFVIRELLDAGLMHADVSTVRAGGLREFTRIPCGSAAAGLSWRDAGPSGDMSVVRPAAEAFSASGGLKLLLGNLGRSVIKVSAVPDDRHVIEAPARVFDSQEELHAAFNAGELDCDVVCVVRWQGPQANGMPELHKLTPPLAVLQGKGFRVALVTDGRMSGASGKVPAAIHVSPEAAVGGPLAKVRDGDVILVDSITGVLQVRVSDEDWAARQIAQMPEALRQSNGLGLGRELFAGMRRHALTAEEGAPSWM